MVSKVANENKIPIIASEEGSVSSGALACCGIDYEKLGYKAGELAVEVLEGKSVGDIPVTTLDETEIIINEDTLKALDMQKLSADNIKYIKSDENAKSAEVKLINFQKIGGNEVGNMKTLYNKYFLIHPNPLKIVLIVAI
ncbi:ABC transporter substrate binding protein [Clostridioides difficile]